MTPGEIVLMDYLDEVPDPRHARGQRHEWRVILVIICAALVSGHKKVSAIAHWAVLHAREIIAALWPSRSAACPVWRPSTGPCGR